MHEAQLQSLGGEDALEEGMATLSSILAWESHGQRSLAGYTVHVAKSRTRLAFTFSACVTLDVMFSRPVNGQNRGLASIHNHENGS